jgi:hypothetical protein
MPQKGGLVAIPDRNPRERSMRRQPAERAGRSPWQPSACQFRALRFDNLDVDETNGACAAAKRRLSWKAPGPQNPRAPGYWNELCSHSHAGVCGFRWGAASLTFCSFSVTVKVSGARLIPKKSAAREVLFPACGAADATVSPAPLKGDQLSGPNLIGRPEHAGHFGSQKGPLRFRHGPQSLS